MLGRNVEKHDFFRMKIYRMADFFWGQQSREIIWNTEKSNTDLYAVFKKYLYIWRVRERERDLPSFGILPKWLQQPVLGQAEARSKELHLCIAHGGRQPKCLDRLPATFHRLLARCFIVSGVSGVQTGTYMECACCRQWLYLPCYNGSSPHMQF